jgi:hypothetical protein
LQTRFENILKSFFTLNKGEQKGIFWILILIVLLILINILLPFFIAKDNSDFSEFKNEIVEFRMARSNYYDSLNILNKQKQGRLNESEAIKLIKPFNFNPNTLDEAGWLSMGFSQKQFKTINNYRSKGGFFKSKADVKKMYCISDVEYLILEPFICIESSQKNKVKSQKSKNNIPSKPVIKKFENTAPKEIFKYHSTELNSADSALLVLNLNIKPWLALRTLKYINLLGGFYCKEQMLEVYHFPKSYYLKIEDFLLVDTLKLKKIDLNSIEFKQLLKHPYFSYETTKLIFSAKSKSKTKTFTDFQDFKLKTGIADSLSQKIRHYLYFGSPK